MKTDIAKTGN